MTNTPPPPSTENCVFYIGNTNRWPWLKTVATLGKVGKDEWFKREPPLLSDTELAQIVNRGRLEYEFTQYQTFDFFSLSRDCTIVSGRVRDCIEELDPGVHQFVPYEICEPPKLPPQVERRFYLMNVAQREEFLALGHSELRLGISGLIYSTEKDEPLLYAKSGWRPSCHMWKSKLRVDDMRIFVSRDLHDALQKLEILWLRLVMVPLT